MPQLITIAFEKNRALVSNQTAHDADPQTFVNYVDLINDVAGRRRKRPGKGTAKGSNAGAEITALHEFVRLDETTGVATYYIFRAFGTSIQFSTNLGTTWTTCVIPFAPAASAWVFKNFNNRCFATNGKDHLIYFDGTTGPIDGRHWYYVGQDAPAVAAGYQALSLTEYSTGTVSATQGQNAIVGAGTTFVAADVGRWIDINGTRYQVASFTDGTHITITPAWKGTTNGGYLFTIYRGLMDWITGPQYAFTYKNSRTGHESIISPITQVTETNQVGRTITLTGIQHSAAAYQNGYDLIQIYRVAKNGATLVAILAANGGTVANANDGATVNFTETSTPETYLDRDLSDLEAPRVINRRPTDIDGSGNPLGFVSIGEFSGRLFGICPRRSRIFFSAALEDTRVGRVEECWPQEYSFRITGPTGMVELGSGDDSDELVVHTTFGDHIIVGYDPLSFRARRVQTRKSEGFQGGSTVVAGSLVEMHRDKRLIDYGDRRSVQLGDVGSAGTDLGRRIQDKLSACSAANFTKTRLHWFSFNDRDFLFASVPSTSGSTSNDRTFVYDYDLDDSYDWSIGFSAFATIHNTTTGELELWGGTSAGDVFKLLDPTVFTDAGANLAPTFKTAHLRPGGETGKFQLVEIAIFSSDGNPFTGNVYLNEEPNITDPDALGYNFTFVTPPVQYQTAKNKKYKHKPTRSVIFNALQLEVLYPSTNADSNVEKVIIMCVPVTEQQGGVA